MSFSELPQLQLLSKLTGAWLSQALYVAASLDIAAQLDQPRSIEDLAQSVATAPEPLYRLLRLLASEGVFVETSPKVFANTDLSDCLHPSAFGSLRPAALLFGEEHYQAWGELLYSVTTGQPAFDKRYGTSVWEFFENNSRQGAIFDETMRTMAMLGFPALLAAYDFSGIKHLVDLGGGDGTLLASLLSQYPDMRGTLVEIPSVVGRAAATVENFGVSDRCCFQALSFFEKVSVEGDAYMLCRVLQNFTDEQCVRILKNCRAIIPTHAVLLIAEMILPDGNEPFWGKYADLNMLVMTGGRERKFCEYQDLLTQTGFTSPHRIETESPLGLLVASPA